MYLKYVSMHQPPPLPPPPPPKKKKKKKKPSQNDNKYELKMSDDVHFEFYDLRKNSVIYSLAYSRNGFSTRNPVKTTKEVLS